jgi:hypothetical protein
VVAAPRAGRPLSLARDRMHTKAHTVSSHPGVTVITVISCHHRHLHCLGAPRNE